jgi:hypothetical protein
MQRKPEQVIHVPGWEHDGFLPYFREKYILTIKVFVSYLFDGLSF